jgi:type IV secretory pathway VirB6-like protein
MVNPNQDYVSQYAQISNNAHQQHEASIQQGILSQAVNTLFGWFSLHTLIMNLSFIFYSIMSKVMEAVRYTMTAILYKLGPVLIPLILFQSTIHMVKGWFVSYVSVLCWPILWHIVLAMAVTISGNNPTLEQFAFFSFDCQPHCGRNRDRIFVSPGGIHVFKDNV